MSLLTRKGEDAVEHVYSVFRPSVEVAHITSNIFLMGRTHYMTVLSSPGVFKGWGAGSMLG